ncbi:MAG: enoyl-CoA hydratase/isomerase family protein [Psychrobium sp.]|nr:enoyl-CoA hydratase/isomerase family protein [Psychrobium sp.]
MTDALILSHTLNGNIRHIEINRSKYKNALTASMYLDLAKALQQADDDEKIRVVLLSGNEEVFCAGNDLNDFINNPPSDKNAPPFVFLLAINAFKKPLIAATAGPAIGIGTTMLLHCDYVVSSENTLFKMPFVQLGCTPEGGSSLLLPQLIGQRKAAELLLLGKSFDAVTALDYGIINNVCAAGEVIQSALDIATKMAKQPPAAMQAAKALMKAPLLDQIRDTILIEGEVFAKQLQSDEAKQAIGAFLGK